MAGVVPPNNPAKWRKIMKVTASVELKAEVEEELKVPDPTPDKAKALLSEDEQGDD